MPDLTFLCVTRGEPYAEPLLERMGRDARDVGANLLILVDGRDVDTGGLMETVQDQAVAQCDTRYVLVLADDERCSPLMVEWLAAGEYRAADNWCFPRVHFWGDEQHFFPNEPLYPDLQTRLAVKEKSGGRSQVHQGSPHGQGMHAPVAIEHLKFLVHSEQYRREVCAGYEAMGADERFRVFSTPEDYHFTVAPYDPEFTP